MVPNLASLGLLLITPFSEDLFNTCLGNNYFGRFGANAIFKTDSECLAATTTFLGEGTFAPYTSHPGRQLVWLEEEAIEPSLKTDVPTLSDPATLDALVQTLLGQAQEELVLQQEGQAVLSSSLDTESAVQVVHNTPDAVLLALPAAPAALAELSTRLPPFWRIRPLPASPLRHTPVPSAARARLRALVDGLKFDPDVAALVQSISPSQLRSDIRYLTGEDSASPIVSRHSFAEGSRTAAAWIKEQVEATGALCQLTPFLVGFAPNVICTYFAASTETNATVLLSAHYDSRGSFGSTRAPGGDDDGSGTIAVLGIARAIGNNRVRFAGANVQLVWFAGEEQGLLGSRAYAKALKEAGANITLMIQADMLGYHAPGEPPQLGLPQYIGTTEVTELVGNMSSLYSPELMVGYTAACCSDHQSFYEQGFPSTQVFERAGPIADPMYHNSGDVSDRSGYDFRQIKSIAKVQFATLLHAAGYALPKNGDA